MKWYPWLRPSFEHLVGNWQAGRGHHAVLIHALPGMGDDALIYALSRWRMCQQPQGQKSCGACRACQLMQAGTHPDYYQAEPEKGKSTLGIDAIREINEKLYDRARLGGAKVVWIKEAALLTEAAANALLKTLEEPPENTWFLLGCREPEQLPATLRSRCFAGISRRRSRVTPKPGLRAKRRRMRRALTPRCASRAVRPPRRWSCSSRSSGSSAWRLATKPQRRSRAATGFPCYPHSIMSRPRFGSTGSPPS